MIVPLPSGSLPQCSVIPRHFSGSLHVRDYDILGFVSQILTQFVTHHRYVMFTENLEIL